jgi:hypothetical protein
MKKEAHLHTESETEKEIERIKESHVHDHRSCVPPTVAKNGRLERGQYCQIQNLQTTKPMVNLDLPIFLRCTRNDLFRVFFGYDHSTGTWQ